MPRKLKHLYSGDLVNRGPTVFGSAASEKREAHRMRLYHGLAGLEDHDISCVIASQGKMADAMGFSVR